MAPVKRHGSFQFWWSSIRVEAVGAHATDSDGRQLSILTTTYGEAVTIARQTITSSKYPMSFRSWVPHAIAHVVHRILLV